MKIKQQLHVTGIMSGSSMDGLDVALCQFSKNNNKINFKILKVTTLQYPPKIIKILNDIRIVSIKEFFEYDVIYGQWIGKKVKQWLSKNNLKSDIIAVHGHTVLHHPEKGYSVQLGNAFQIAAICNLPTIHDFRNTDIALKGQGAPLVPIGDQWLFNQYDACVNIGGIANIFIQKTNMAYDICIANMALNYFANKIHLQYDRNGAIAKKGIVNNRLLQELNQLKYLHQKPPKSLNREYFETRYLPVIEKYSLSAKDKLATLSEHIAFQISQSIKSKHIKKVLITGGGAFNNFLIQRIQFYSKKEIVIPDKIIVKYKETLIFALLGYLRWNKEYGNIATATGAIKNTLCGLIVEI